MAAIGALLQMTVFQLVGIPVTALWAIKSLCRTIRITLNLMVKHVLENLADFFEI